MTNNASTTTTSALRKRTLSSDVETFDFANRDPYAAKIWINHIGLTAKVSGLPDEDWSAAAILKLRGTAQIWGHNLYQTKPDVTWLEFKAAFNRQFGCEELESTCCVNHAAVTWENANTPNSYFQRYTRSSLPLATFNRETGHGTTSRLPARSNYR
ncbi:hypothetical protein EC991_007958 [Linnemannia zychae]|nr:hypothetical protein EC991_007958 [Linnemannia zychae]